MASNELLFLPIESDGVNNDTSTPITQTNGPGGGRSVHDWPPTLLWSTVLKIPSHRFTPLEYSTNTPLESVVRKSFRYGPPNLTQT